MPTVVKKGLSPQERRVQRERARQYGDHVHGHANLGLLWTALLQNHYGIQLSHPVPASLAELMMAANKLNRAATPTPGHPDDYRDAAIYVRLSEDAKRQERRKR
jgi:hypothetical protein